MKQNYHMNANTNSHSRAIIHKAKASNTTLAHRFGVLEGLSATSVLTGSVHTTVNALREAFAIQKVLERDARGGTRYIEIIKAQLMLRPTRLKSL
jgi:hypothetical protein